MIISFPDGSRLDQDARREDRLFYYVRAVDWSDAVGFIVLPEYAEHTARSVTLQVYPPHASRIMEMISTDIDLMAIRLIVGLSEHFRHWVELQIDWQPSGLGQVGRGAFARAAVQAGWRPVAGSADGVLYFTRRAPQQPGR